MAWITGNFKLMLIPIVMFLNLYFNHIPESEEYLKKDIQINGNHMKKCKILIPYIL